MAPSSLPIGVLLLRRFGPSCHRIRRSNIYKSSVIFLTFIAYMSYHLSRRPLSVVKTALNRNCSSLTPPPGTNTSNPCWCCWAPFDKDNANSLLGLLDSSFLISYAIFMFISGFVAERCHLRYFLALGMVGSGIFTYLLGVAFYYDIHSIYYFIIVQIICGALQTTGWPAVVATVGNWFGTRSNRGFIFGIWNSHTSLGNIFGALVAGAFLEYNWGLSFIVPGLIVASVGLILYLFLVPYPEEVGLATADVQEVVETIPNYLTEASNVFSKNKFNKNHRRKVGHVKRSSLNTNSDEEVPLIEDENQVRFSHDKDAISFLSALKIPGVVEFSLSLFFCKLVSYTFLYWLPKYLGDSTGASSMKSAFLSTPFDVGGAVGAIGAGMVADKSRCPALTCLAMLVFAFPALFAYHIYGTLSNWDNLIFQTILGILVNGPYALITTAVSVDLGNKVTNSQALATVGAIIDGVGSVGAALGPFVAGVVSQGGWQNVFYMVYSANILSIVFLLRLGVKEIPRMRC